MSDEEIRRIAESKQLRIYEKIGHPQKYQNLPHPPGKELVSCETALYLGRQCRIELVKTGQSTIRFDQRFLIPATQGKKRVEALRKWYIGKAGERIISRVKYHARALGVEVAEVKIVDNRYRWGSCTVNDNVNFNWRLIKPPCLSSTTLLFMNSLTSLRPITQAGSGILSGHRLRPWRRRRHG